MAMRHRQCKTQLPLEGSSCCQREHTHCTRAQNFVRVMYLENCTRGLLIFEPLTSLLMAKSSFRVAAALAAAVATAAPMRHPIVHVPGMTASALQYAGGTSKFAACNRSSPIYPLPPNTSWLCLADWFDVRFNASSQAFDALAGVGAVDFGGWDGLVYGPPLKQA